MKILTIVGARPQFIKAAMVSKALRRKQDTKEVLIHTGQHYDEKMSNTFFKELEITEPKYNLGIGSATHPKQTARMIEALEIVLKKENGDIVVVYGDTNSTLAGAITAAQLKIPIAHVEAGLRSFNRLMPEEINRVVTDHLSDVLFSPTKTAVANLKNEGIENLKIHMVGDVMYDAALYYSHKAEYLSSALEIHDLEAGKYILVSVHRAQNTDDPDRLKNIFKSLIEISSSEKIILPLHPRTRQKLSELDLLGAIKQQISLIPPVGYLDMTKLLKYASLVITDSGGLQKEAFFFGVPCLTLREETEWLELVELGANRLVGANSDTITAAYKEKVKLNEIKEKPYGEGNASGKIVELLISQKYSDNS